jgi:osmotically-inducible protein OsmY
VILLHNCAEEEHLQQNFRSSFCAFVLSAGLLLASPVAAQQSQHDADNTAVNKRDRNASEPTADNAKNNMSDRELMAHIRQDVVRDGSISTYGHNVKIIASHGKVTLKGPVRSDDERRAIEEHARKYAGEGNIDNRLTVKEEHKRG